MAIRLASAIGQQREPIGILGGLDEAINRTGDAIQAANQRKAAEEAKKRDAALQAAANIDTDINALPEDNKRYKEEAKKLIGGVLSLYAKGASPSEIAAKAREVENALAPMKNRYEKDFVDFQNIEKFAKESENKRDLSEATTFLTGASKAEVPMPAQAPTDRAMPVNKEDVDTTEVVDVQQTPYWELDWKEREKVAPGGVYTEVIKRSKDITGNFDDAIDGYVGGKFDPQSRFTNLQDVLKAGGLDKQQVIVDTDAIAKEKSAFVSSFGSDLGDAKTQQYWNTLTTLAAKNGRKAGLTGDRLKEFVESNVKKTAAADFDRRVQQEIEKTKVKKIDQDPDREGKGLNINFLGGGKYQTKTGFYQIDRDKTDTETREQQFRNFDERNREQIIKNWAKGYTKYPANATEDEKQEIDYAATQKAEKLYDSESGKKSVKELFDKNYPEGKKVTRVYPALTPKQDGSNPEVNVVDSRGRTIAFTPSFYNIDEETNKPISIYGVEVVKEKDDNGVTKTVQKPVTIPYNAKNKVVNNVAPELIEVYKQETGNDINLEVEETPKAAAKEVSYGVRNDGTPKGKGYFGELKTSDGKIATEISIKFDDVLGGAEIPSLVPTLTESEKQYLLKGNKPTKEIQLKAIKHAEERASKGLSPFVDGGELKSKSGKPIYWDKTAKTYKYK